MKTGSLKGIPIRVEAAVRGPAAEAGAAAAAAAPQTVEIDLFEKHRKVYPRAVTGRFASLRWVMVWVTQLVFYGLPWIPWGDRQAVLFDLGARKFYLFGLVMWPQDFIFLALLLIICAFGLFLVTAVAGRVWCGYACPQTVYTEIFMWIERRIEGDRIARMKLDAGPWNVDRVWRKTAKQAAWIAVALWTGFTFVGYFTPIRTLAGEIATLSLGPWETFWVLFYGFATYGNAGFMREQVCKYMCPYARFQSAMFDRDTLIIGYDPARGEARGSRSRKADRHALGLGDCIDCGLCVQVCPTGIDIRNGLQYDCIACGACVDVCDDVMGKMQYPKGLIRYTTQRALDSGADAGGADTRALWRRLLRPRTVVYTVVLLAIAAGFVGGIALRAPVRVDVLRDRNTLAEVVEDRIENAYRLQMMNMTERPARYVVTVAGLPGARIVSPDEVRLESTESRALPVRVQVPAASLSSGARRIEFIVTDPERGTSVRERSSFIVPR